MRASRKGSLSTDVVAAWLDFTEKKSQPQVETDRR